MRVFHFHLTEEGEHDELFINRFFYSQWMWLLILSGTLIDRGVFSIGATSPLVLQMASERGDGDGESKLSLFYEG